MYTFKYAFSWGKSSKTDPFGNVTRFFHTSVYRLRTNASTFIFITFYLILTQKVETLIAVVIFN